jgi:hypothetical protein
MSGVDNLHKILKDPTRRKAILLLNGSSLTYTELMDKLEIISTGTLNYHLKVLGDLVTKNGNDQYTLTSRGNLAYQVLTQFPDQSQPVQDKRIYKAWIVMTAAAVFMAVISCYYLQIPPFRTAVTVAVLLVTTAFAFYVRIKPSARGNRVFYISAGAFTLGAVFWLLIFAFMNYSGLRWSIVRSSGDLSFDFFTAAMLVVCWVAGGFVGDLIGKRRSYKIAPPKI